MRKTLLDLINCDFCISNQGLSFHGGGSVASELPCRHLNLNCGRGYGGNRKLPLLKWQKT